MASSSSKRQKAKKSLSWDVTSLIQIVSDLATQVQSMTLQVAALKTVETSSTCHVARRVTTTVTTSAPSTSPAWPNYNGLAIPVTGAEPLVGGLQPPPGFTPLLPPVPGIWEAPTASGLLASSSVPATNPVSPQEPAASRLGEQFLDNSAEASRPEKAPAAMAKAVLAKTGAILKHRRQAKNTTRPAIPEMTTPQESTSYDSGSKTSGDTSSSCLSVSSAFTVSTGHVQSL
ncbi:uncharacterized protein [Palaemon carinicauda]|uniref:uncharacterized protein n=1 Tax=Palaemon carinicauda TaxID=392227 RepID=UPI0035B63737